MNVTRHENKIFSSNTYIFSCEKIKEFWIIDIGDLSHVFKYVEEGFSLRGVFLTHSHYDHIYGINSLIDIYPDCFVYASEFAVKGLFSDRLNMSFYHDDPIVFKGSKIHILHENEKIELFDHIFLEVLETPGHNEGCLTFKVQNYLFTGDSYIPNIKVVTKLRGGDREASKRSLIKIMENILPDTMICPGHGEMIAGSVC